MEGLRNMNSVFSGSLPDRALCIPRGTDLYSTTLETFLNTDFSKIPVLTAKTIQWLTNLFLLDPWLYVFLAANFPASGNNYGYNKTAEDICNIFKEEKYNTLVSPLNSLNLIQLIDLLLTTMTHSSFGQWSACWFLYCSVYKSLSLNSFIDPNVGLHFESIGLPFGPSSESFRSERVFSAIASYIVL